MNCKQCVLEILRISAVFAIFYAFVLLNRTFFFRYVCGESLSAHDLPLARAQHGRMAAAAVAPYAVSGALKIYLPPAFKGDGTESFTSWSRRFEVAVQAVSSPDADISTVMASVLPTRLADAAFLYWNSLPAATQSDYDSAKDKLKDFFGPKYSLPFFQTTGNARPRKHGESLDVYSADITQIKSNQFYLYSPKSQITNLPRGALQSVQDTTPSVLDSATLTSAKEKLNHKKTLLTGRKNGRNLRKSDRGGIPLPGWTDVQ